jgi:predicted MFS family arabinose efflux permease
VNKPTPFSAYQWLLVTLLALTQFTVVLDFMVMSPLGDLLIKDLKIKPSEFGLVVSSYALAAGFSGMLTAGFADRFDRKKLLLFFYSGFILGTLICGISQTYYQLVISRIFTGIFGGVMSSISLAIIADTFSLNQRGRAMSFIQMGFGLSQILGIPISLFIAERWHWQTPFFLIVGLSLFMFFSILLGIKSLPIEQANQTKNAFKHLLNTIRNKEYRIGFLATAFMSLGGYFMMPWGSTFSVNNVGIQQIQLPLMFMIVGLATFFIMPFVGILSDKFNKFKLFLFASLAMVVAVSIYVHLGQTSLTVLILVNVLMMGGIMARMVPSQALSSAVPQPADRGAYMSINASLQQLAGGIAAFLGGMIVFQKSPNAPLERFDLLGYVVIGVIAINIFFTYRVYQIIKTKNGD